MNHQLVKDDIYKALSKHVDHESAALTAEMVMFEVKDEKEKDLRSSILALRERFTDFEYKDIGKFLFDAQQEIWRLKEVYDEVFERKDDDDYLKFLKKKYESQKDLVHEGGVKGYKLNHLNFYERMCDGLREGLHYIGAHPNVGKTSLLCTMTWDVLSSNKHVSVLFITIDDTREKITNNILACASNRSQNIVDRKRNDVDAHAVDKAYTQVIGWTMEKRLNVVDSSSFDNEPNNLYNIIQKARKNYDNLVVFVDGIANLNMKGTGEERHSNIAMMFKHLWKPTMSGLPAIPIVLSSELKRTEGKRPKKNDLKGSSKYEYTADVVACLSAEDEEAFNAKRNMRVIIDIDKNKMGSGKGFVYSVFDPDKSKFTEDSF